MEAIETNEKMNLSITRETMSKFYALRHEEICDWIFLNKRFLYRNMILDFSVDAS